VPQGWASQLNVAIRTHHIYASMFSIEALRMLMAEKSLERIWAQSSTLVGERIAQARAVLEPYELRSHRHSWFAWLKLPGTWNSETFTSAARLQGIAVGGSANFTIDGVDADQNGVRLSLTGPATTVALRDYCLKLRSLLDAGPQRYGRGVE
jgi:DNA-binding transcriptional MocR family regulator